MAVRQNPARTAITKAIALVERYEMPLTFQNIRKNVDTSGLTLGDATAALERYIKSQIPLMLKEQGKVIVDTTTRERKDFWQSVVSELEEQLRIKQESNTFDRRRLAADTAVITFLREKEKELGYEPYPGLFQDDINRIYAMHGVAGP